MDTTPPMDAAAFVASERVRKLRSAGHKCAYVGPDNAVVWCKKTPCGQIEYDDDNDRTQ